MASPRDCSRSECGRSVRDDEWPVDKGFLATEVPTIAMDLAPSKWVLGHPALYTNVYYYPTAWPASYSRSLPRPSISDTNHPKVV